LNLTDATIALLLAANIHGKGSAVKATAKRCSQLLPRSKRDLMFMVMVMNSSEPMKLVEHIVQNLDIGPFFWPIFAGLQGLLWVDRDLDLSGFFARWFEA
jgi:hypothetical protein